MAEARRRKKQRPLPPLWRCPKCGKKFVVKNLSHSCRTHDLRPLFARCDPRVFRMYRKFERMVKACGPVTVEPRSNEVVFLVRVRTMAFTPARSSAQLRLAFARPGRHRRFIKTFRFSSRFHAHWIRVRDLTELDAQVQAWVREAYSLSAQKPLPHTKR
jgi:hypothetical protein